MKGFTKDAIILLPKPEAYYGKDEFLKLNLRRSVNAAIAFINKVVGANAVMLTSDEVAVDLFADNKSVKWWNALPPEDCNFARRNCDGLSHMPEGLDFEDLYVEARRKYPIEGKLDSIARFAIANKREKFSANKLIKECKLVITFENQNNAGYKVEKALNKDRAVFIVNPLNFIVSAFFAGQPIDIVGFTEKPWAMSPMHSWEVPNA